MANIGHRGLHASFWGGLEIAVRYGVQIAVTVILARLLVPDDFGLIAILLVFTSVGALLADAGFGTALIQRREHTIDDETTMFFISLGTGFAATLILYLTANIIADFYNKPTLAPLTKFMAWALFFGSAGAVPDALLTKRLDFNARTRAQALSSIVSGALAIILALQKFGVWSLAWQGMTETVLRTFFMWQFSRWMPRGRFRVDSFRALFNFGGYMLLAGVLSTISSRLQSLVIGKLFTARDLGYYVLAQNTQAAPSSVVAILLNRIGLPVFSSMAHDRAQLRLALQVSLQASMFVFFPCMLGLAMIAKPFVTMMYGAQWTPATPMLTLLALAASIWPIHVLNLLALSACGRSDRFLRLELIKNIVVVAVTLLASLFGPTAVAAAMLVAGICAAWINTWYSKRTFDYGLLQQIVDLKSTLLITLIAMLPAWAILHWAPEGIVMTLAAVCSAIVVYVGMARLSKHPALIEIIHVLKLVGEAYSKKTSSRHDP
ncbi:lipopolysaccharide biosynthesis protein [Dyella jejuensis]|uniref:Lipopolysaccharide biosynthesis protein n=1 Tax=Dyella jejuensis TaxID=1432009 RepID=A0ABW8JKT1_9GAMM